MLKNVNIAAYFIQCLDWYKKTQYMHSIMTIIITPKIIFNNTFTNIKNKTTNYDVASKNDVAIIVTMHSSEVSWSMFNN